MDFIKYILEGCIRFSVASIPLLIVFILLKIYKLKPKQIIIFLILNLSLNIYYLVQIKNLSLGIYFGLAHLAAFLWICTESIYIKVKLLDTIKRIIIEWNPVELLAHVPKIEYDDEIKEIYDSFTEDIDKLSEIIFTIFNKSFHNAFNKSVDDCKKIALLILKGD